MISKETYQKLKAYEKSYQTAQRDWMSLPTRDNLEAMSEAYKEIFSKAYIDNGCSKCRTTAYKQVAEHYFKAKEEYEREADAEHIEGGERGQVDVNNTAKPTTTRKGSKSKH